MTSTSNKPEKSGLCVSQAVALKRELNATFRAKKHAVNN
jgi:hypothetical protein